MPQRTFRNSVSFSKVFGLLACLAGLFAAAAPAAHAQVLVSGFYSQVGMNYLYNFTVSNPTGVDVSVVDVTIPSFPGISYISNVVSPAGFAPLNVDTTTGLLGFAEDTKAFTANSTVGGFSLTSTRFLPNAPANVVDINGGTPSGSFVSVAVPEAATLPLILLAAPALTLLGAVARRRAA